MAVRSRRFFGPVFPTAAATWTQLYDVPDGRTARFGLITIEAAGPRTALLGIGTAAGVTGVIGRYVFGANGGSLEVMDELVLDPDDRLFAWSDTANSVTFAGFGSLLEGAPS